MDEIEQLFEKIKTKELTIDEALEVYLAQKNKERSERNAYHRNYQRERKKKDPVFANKLRMWSRDGYRTRMKDPVKREKERNRASKIPIKLRKNSNEEE